MAYQLYQVQADTLDPILQARHVGAFAETQYDTLVVPTNHVVLPYPIPQGVVLPLIDTEVRSSYDLAVAGVMRGELVFDLRHAQLLVLDNEFTGYFSFISHQSGTDIQSSRSFC